MKRIGGLLLVLALAQLPHTDAGSYGGFSDSTSSTASFAAASSFDSCPQPTTLIAGRDATIDQAAPARNFGSASTLTVRSQAAQNARALVGFDLPPMGGCQVVSAQLRLYQQPGPHRVLGAYRVASPWNEPSVTWSNAPTSGGSPALTGVPGGGWVAFDVTAQVRLMFPWTTYDLIVKDTTENAAVPVMETFTSADSSASSERPQLLLVFG